MRNGHTYLGRRNPAKPAFRLADLAERRISEQTRWRNIVRGDREIVDSIMTNQSTMRLAMVVPTWTNFCQTRYFHEMGQHLDGAMIKRYRSWWNLLLLCSEDRMRRKESFAYAYALVKAEAYQRLGGPPQVVRWEKFRLKESNAEAIRDFVRTEIAGLLVP